jgi:DNA-binding NarL/FixJ family response regulator
MPEGGVLKVLLVEDSNLLSDRLLELISEIQGVKAIGTATTEAAAINAVGTNVPDAVVLDLRLSQGTGFGVLRYIQTLTHKPVVIVMSNYALPQYRTQAHTLGARYFLDKLQQFDQLPELLTSIRAEMASGKPN